MHNLFTKLFVTRRAQIHSFKHFHFVASFREKLVGKVSLTVNYSRIVINCGIEKPKNGRINLQLKSMRRLTLLLRFNASICLKLRTYIHTNVRKINYVFSFPRNTL